MRSISRRTAVWASATVLAVGVAAAGLALTSAGGGHGSGQAAGSAGGQADGAGVIGGQAARVAATAHPAATPRPEPLRLVSVNPRGGATAVNGTSAITVTYNQPLPASAALPRLSPRVPGRWRRAGDTVMFTPATGYPAGTKVTVTAAVNGAVTRPVTRAGAGNARDRSGQSSTFTTGRYSALRLQEVLAQLGYLPLTWQPAAGAAVRAGNVAAQLAAAYSPPSGRFTWQRGYPARLRSFWRQGSPNTLVSGAVTGFEGDHQMATDGVAGPAVWRALLTAAAAGQRNTQGYSYAIASQRVPETLTIWHNGREVLSTPSNTGISVAPSPVGTFPVYEKLPYQVMQGVNPDGTTYADPVQWVSYFSGGSAVHYFDRASYGWQQSLGCVELPYTAAEEAYPYLPYGTLVTVTPE